MAEDRNLILAFESSCDETSVAVIENGNKILSNIVATQIKSHKRFGGVVPEVASRHHIEQVTYCIDDALCEANVDYDDLDAVAVTYGPGLVGSLLVGVTAAKTVAYAHDLPLVPVNHMAGHIYAARFAGELHFPALALLVSGGHTELVYLSGPYDFKIIGETRDDACGEAYDKVGRVLGLTYPAGKQIDEMAHKGQDTFHFPRAMEKEDNFDFSFSGLKSAFINTVHHADQIGEKLDENDRSSKSATDMNPLNLTFFGFVTSNSCHLPSQNFFFCSSVIPLMKNFTFSYSLRSVLAIGVLFLASCKNLKRIFFEKEASSIFAIFSFKPASFSAPCSDASCKEDAAFSLSCLLT